MREAADLLVESDTIRDPTTRELLLDELETALGVRLDLQETGKLHPRLFQIVRACVEHTGGLRSLSECLDLLEPNTDRAHALELLADEWQVFERFADHNVSWLRADLNSAGLSDDLWDFIAGRPGEPVPDYCDSPWRVFAHLASQPDPATRPTWLRFLDRLTVQVPSRSHQRLRDLTKALAEEWIVPEMVPAPPTPAAAGKGTALLAFQFERYGADEDTYILSHWYQWEPGAWQPTKGTDQYVRREDLESAVDSIVTDIERTWHDRAGLVSIEFVLPAPLLNEPVDRWRLEIESRLPRQLSIRYPVVIRSLERLRADYWHRAWRTRWRSLLGATSAAETVHCIDPDHSEVQLEATLEEKAAAVVVVLSEPPTPDSVGERQLLVALRSGMPGIVWERSFEPRRGDLCEVVTSMVDTELTASANSDAFSSQGVAKLPLRVAELRRAAWHEDPKILEGHAGHRLVILWDDPNRQPGRPASFSSHEGRVRA